jgi:hypothetical protein
MKRAAVPMIVSIILLAIASVADDATVGFLCLMGCLRAIAKLMQGETVVNPRYHAKLNDVLGNMTCSDEEARRNLRELKALE